MANVEAASGNRVPDHSPGRQAVRPAFARRLTRGLLAGGLLAASLSTTGFFTNGFSANGFLTTGSALAATPVDLRTALEAEAAGDESARARALADALQAAPDDAAVRGAAGFLKQGRRWVAYEQAVEEARNDKRLAEYRERRKASAPTVASQLELADWCRGKRLEAQQRAHLTAVLSLDPEHAAARQRLGFVRVADRWVAPDELQASRTAARQTAEAFRRLGPALDALAKQILRGDVAEADAVERLREFDEPAQILAIETHVSPSGEAAARCAVQALARSRRPEASQSLARHALASPWPAVRALAAEQLRPRDPHSFVPALLAEFETPWSSQAELYRAADGRLLCRYSLFSDGPEKRQLAVHDHVLMPVGFLPDAQRQAAGQTAVGVLGRQLAVGAENRRIEEKNSALAALLAEATGETEIGADPADWWRWWNDQNECYVDGAKPLEQTYAVTSSYVVGSAPIQETVGTGQNRGECLAGGTLVWTATGPVAVDRLKIGDVVLAQHPVTGELALKPVLRTTVRAPEKLLVLHSGDQTLRATGGHPFWVAGKGWTLARQIRPGDRLHGLAGAISIDAVEEESEPVRTFNLVVADFHSYFCGPEKALSHDNSLRAPVVGGMPGLAD